MFAPERLGAQAQTISCTASGNPCWWTGGFDNHRDSHNNNETTLLNSTVCGVSGCSNPVQQLAILAVDSVPNLNSPQNRSNPVYAQPLYVPNIKINGAPSGSKCYNGATCNLVVASTLNGTLFAWDADTYILIWSRQGFPGHGQGTAGDAFWYGDCDGSEGGSGPVIAGGGGIPFFGSVSTGVIDFSNTTSSPAVLYLTSACANAANGIQAAWFLHGIDLLTGSDISGSPVAINPANFSGSAVPLNSPCTGGADGCVSCAGQTGCPSGGYWIVFDDIVQNQKPALLLVPDANSHPMIYVALGAFNEVGEGSPLRHLHGWIVRFKTTGGTLQTPTFVVNTSNLGPTGNTGSPGCSQSAGLAWYSASGVVNATGVTFPVGSSQCGHGGTPWSSTRGIAASETLGEVNANVFDIYAGVSNGPYQGGGSASAQNIGQSMLHFKSSQDSSTAYTAFAPVDYFTPIGQQQWPTGSYLNSSGTVVVPTGGAQDCGPILSGFSSSYTGGTPCTPALQPPQVDSACPCTTGPCSGGNSSWTFCTTTALVENGADWDQSTPGEILFKDPNDNNNPWKVVTSSKDGYAHVLNAANLGGAQTYDTGDQFTFAAANLLCPDVTANFPGGPLNEDCDRLTSMALYSYESTACGGTTCTELAIWPNDQVAGGERLTALQISPRDAGHWAPSGTSFARQVIAGDQIVACGCTVAAGNCPVITKVFGGAHPPYLITASGPPSGCNISTGLSYAGYFINPRPDSSPLPSGTGYPGGSLTVASSTSTSSDGVIWAVIPNDVNYDGKESADTIRTPGTLYGYNAVPGDGLVMLWNSAPAVCSNCQCFCANSFTLPTVAHGKVFLGTDAILPAGTTAGAVNCPTDASSDSFPTFASGVIVYGFPSQQ